MTTALNPMPQSIADIRDVLCRDRRGDDRRWGKRDTRIFRYNRRGIERRMPRECSDLVEEDMIVEISELVSELELLSLEVGESTRGDLTCIQERPQISDS